MCGIAGYISLKSTIGPGELVKATSSLEHRGPDAEGFYFSEDKKVGLGHRRLSILDLSSSANQPMFTRDGRYVMVYNGEMYNFKELKQTLSDKGDSLNTTSDTEIILRIFEEQGVQCFRLFNGMFALAIYDTEAQVLTLCRDHMGIKPLFVYRDEENLVFASELKAIQSIRTQRLSINKKAIPYFLHLGFIPQPLTIFEGVEKFPPAHFLQLTTTGPSLAPLRENMRPFWNIDESINSSSLKDEKAAKQKLTELLFDSVEKQLVSDVPIGTLLSGGVDSSLVTAIATKISRPRVSTFSIAVDEKKYDESVYAQQVAKCLGTDHHEFRVREKEILELMNDLLPAYDEPFADSSALPTMIVSKLAKKHVTVALSGDGGDELFLGYGAYRWANLLNNPGVALIRKPLFEASKLMNDRYRRAGKLLAYPKKENVRSHIFSQEQYFFSESELNDILMLPQVDFDALNKSTTKGRKLTASEEQSLWDLHYYLPDDLLVKTDRASMLFALEMRVPLLDTRIIEFAYNLDSNLKIKGGENKYLLKQVLYDFLPKKIFDRAKWGFSIPLKKWLKSDLAYLVDKYTCNAIIEKYNFLDSNEVEKLKRKYAAGHDYLFNRLWVIIVLHWWLEENSTYAW